MPVLADLDPRALSAHPGNARRDPGDLAELAASIQALGVLQPLVVAPTNEGGHRVVAGHRRCAAAIQAGLATVPCLVYDGLDDTGELVGNLVENVHRRQLTAGEEAAGYQQLAIAGLSAAAIAKATGTKAKRVKAALAVAGNELAAATADRYEFLTLDQAAELARWDDDPDTVKALVVAARAGRWDHTLAQLRADRRAAQALTAARAGLAQRGITVLDATPSWSLRAGQPCRLSELTDTDGARLDPDQHAVCPGHAAWLGDVDDEPLWTCTDPAAHGHRPRYGIGAVGHAGHDSGTPKPASDTERAEAAEARREVIENNRAWRHAATPVRLDWIRQLLGRRTAPKGTLRYLVGVLMERPELLGHATDAQLAELTGAEHDNTRYGRHVGPNLVDTAGTDSRLLLALLAQLAASIEGGMGDGWRHPDKHRASWLTFLASTGYQLADVEQLLIDRAAQRS